MISNLCSATSSTCNISANIGACSSSTSNVIAPSNIDYLWETPLLSPKIREQILLQEQRQEQQPHQQQPKAQRQQQKEEKLAKSHGQQPKERPQHAYQMRRCPLKQEQPIRSQNKHDYYHYYKNSNRKNHITTKPVTPTKEKTKATKTTSMKAKCNIKTKAVGASPITTKMPRLTTSLRAPLPPSPPPPTGSPNYDRTNACIINQIQNRNKSSLIINKATSPLSTTPIVRERMPSMPSAKVLMPFMNIHTNNDDRRINTCAMPTICSTSANSASISNNINNNSNSHKKNKTIYLIRHAESLGQIAHSNGMDRKTDAKLLDCTLSSKGISQAKLIPTLIDPKELKEIQLIVSSPLTRAVLTSLLAFSSSSNDNKNYYTSYNDFHKEENEQETRQPTVTTSNNAPIPILLHYDLREIGSRAPENIPRKIEHVLNDVMKNSHLRFLDDEKRNDHSNADDDGVRTNKNDRYDTCDKKLIHNDNSENNNNNSLVSSYRLSHPYNRMDYTSLKPYDWPRDYSPIVVRKNRIRQVLTYLATQRQEQTIAIVCHCNVIRELFLDAILVDNNNDDVYEDTNNEYDNNATLSTTLTKTRGSRGEPITTSTIPTRSSDDTENTALQVSSPRKTTARNSKRTKVTPPYNGRQPQRQQQQQPRHRKKTAKLQVKPMNAFPIRCELSNTGQLLVSKQEATTNPCIQIM